MHFAADRKSIESERERPREREGEGEEGEREEGKAYQHIFLLTAI